MPNPPSEAARRLLARAGAGAYGPGDALVLPAAAALSSKEPVGTLPDPSRALAAACGLPESTPDRLEPLAAAVPPPDRPFVFAELEPLLARLDPAWAWDLVLRLAGEEETLRHGTLGLDIAAKLEEEAARALLARKIEHNALFARQWAADVASRRREDVFARLEEGTLGPVRMLLPSECRSYLVAAALVDPDRALGLADTMLATVPPEGLTPALALLAQAAAGKGLGADVCERARREDFITVQAAWTEAAAAAGALTGSILVEHMKELARGVGNQLDPGRELVAGLPLVIALAHGGVAEPLPEEALAWGLPASLLTDQVFQAGLRLPASVLDPLLALPEEEWSDLYPYDFGWWRDAIGQEDSTRRLACADVLALAESVPWWPLPGSLADTCHWPMALIGALRGGWADAPTGSATTRL